MILQGEWAHRHPVLHLPLSERDATVKKRYRIRVKAQARPPHARVADEANFRAPSGERACERKSWDRTRAWERRSTAQESPGYSHSIVPGGFDVMSSVTRLTCAISLIIREATFSSRS
jgi:hypothetical protein